MTGYKKYYVHINNKVLGPYTIEQLKNLSIKPKTLIWTKESKIWKKASEFNELKDIIYPTKSVDYINLTEEGILKEKYKNPATYKRKILSGKGRINRIEYLLSLIVFSIGVSFTQSLVEIEGWRLVGSILYFFLLWFILAQGAKRCHDFGRSGWLQLIPLYPLYMLIKKGDSKVNSYGPVPK